MYLVDTDVLSALRKPQRNVAVARWVSAQGNEDLHLSVITIGEIERGITATRQRDSAFASALDAWLKEVLRHYGNRILPVDLSGARRWGRLTQAIGHRGVDLLIAATALDHGLTVATRNARHFEPTGVPVLNPFDAP